MGGVSTTAGKVRMVSSAIIKASQQCPIVTDFIAYFLSIIAGGEASCDLE
jgi:hypothetical protein